MKAFVLAAGVGRRFKRGGIGYPKQMALLDGKPVLEHVIEHLRASGIRQIIMNLHDEPEMIENFFGDGRRWGVRITYSFEPELLGTAGAVRKYREEFDRTFLVYYGDNLCDFDIRGMERFHRRRRSFATILVSESYDSLAGGIIESDEGGRVARFAEKPAAARKDVRLENGGVYILEPQVIDFIPSGRASDFGKDVFPALLSAERRVFCYRAEGHVRGIDTPERYRRLLAELAEGKIEIRRRQP